MKKKLLGMMALLISLGLISCGDDSYTILDGNYEIIVDDDGVPSGKPGTEDMIGYYSSLGLESETWKNANETIKKYAKETKNQPLYYYTYPFATNSAFRIMDEKTIYFVKEEIYGSSSNGTDETQIECCSYEYRYKVYIDLYHERTDYAYLYVWHTIEKYPDLSKGSQWWEGRYALNGNNMTVNTDLGETITMTYSNHEIIWNGTVFTKVSN